MGINVDSLCYFLLFQFFCWLGLQFDLKFLFARHSGHHESLESHWFAGPRVFCSLTESVRDLGAFHRFFEFNVNFFLLT